MVYAYVPNNTDGTVSVINTSTDAVIATISVGSFPQGAAVSPDGSKAYITNGGGTVSVINTATNIVIATITVGSGAFGAAVSPDGTRLYVANASANTVSVINTVTNTVISTISGFTTPEGVAITPDGKKVYVVNNGAHTISVINTATNTISTTITVAASANLMGPITVSPDGTFAYVSATGLNEEIIVINTPTDTVSGTITLSAQPYCIAFTPDSKTAYVSIDNTSPNGEVLVIDTASSTVTSTITITGKDVNRGIALTPDATKAYTVLNGSQAVAVINTATNTVSTTITVGNSPWGIGQFIQASSAQPVIPPGTAPTLLALPPQGRLTLSSTSPVMTADATAQSTIYYLPYQGALVPVYNGAQYVIYLLGTSGISLVLDSNSAHVGYQASGSLFDIFAFINSSVLTLGIGPAWTNSTTRSNAITQVSGLWVNSSAITLRFGTASGNTVSVPANQATYLGTMYATANGQTGVAIQPAGVAGGCNNIIGLFNAYNRVRAYPRSIDTTSGGWSYSSTTIRPANYGYGSGSNLNNRISFVDGLGQVPILAQYLSGVYPNNDNGNIGIGINSTTTFSNPPSYFGAPSSFPSQGTPAGTSSGYPIMGFNYIQALECNNATAIISYGASATPTLYAMLEY